MPTCLLNSHSALFLVLQHVLVWTSKLLLDNLKTDVLCNDNDNEGCSAVLRTKMLLESESVDSNLVPLLIGYVI